MGIPRLTPFVRSVIAALGSEELSGKGPLAEVLRDPNLVVRLASSTPSLSVAVTRLFGSIERTAPRRVREAFQTASRGDPESPATFIPFFDAIARSVPDAMIVGAANAAGTTRRPPFLRLDLSGAWDHVSAIDVVMERLRKIGLADRNMLFRGFERERMPLIRKHGTDRPYKGTIFASTKDDFINRDGSLAVQSALDYAQQGGGLAIYDGDKFQELGPFLYRPKEGADFMEALLVVFSLVD